MDYDGIEPVTDEEEVFSFIKPAILTPGASERTHRYVRTPPKQNSAEKQV